MNSSRRYFIKSSGAAIAGILCLKNSASGQIGGVSASDLPDGVYSDPLFYFDAEKFREFIGAKFSLTYQEDAPADAILTAVENSSSRRSGRSLNDARCFTLSFTLEFDQPQATYQVFHPHLGTFDLLLVPGKSAAGEYLLHAVINRI